MNILAQETTVMLPKKAVAFFLTSTGVAASLAVIFLIALAGLGVLYLITVIAPGMTSRGASALRQSNLLCFLVGIPVFLVLAGIAAGLHKAGVAKVAGLFMTLTWVAVLIGWTSAAEDLGRRLFWISGREGVRASHLAAGWLVFITASCFPFLGWFLVFPYVTIAGLGTLIVGPFRARAGAQPTAATMKTDLGD